MTEFLDSNLCRKLRDKINETNIFCEDKEYHIYFNLICAVMDRLDSCIEYLNKHSKPPQSEHELLVFSMYACTVIDAIKQLNKQLSIPEKYKEEKRIFKGICTSSPLNIKSENCPTDENFFEYLRALIFAHPFETSRQKFLKKNNEIQYSPFVIAKSHSAIVLGKKNIIGVRIYSSLNDDIKDLKFPFNLLKKFIKSRYELLEDVNCWVQRVIDKKYDEWKEHKVNRFIEPLNVWKDILNILKERYQEHYTIDIVIDFLTCNITNSANTNIVFKYREEINNVLPLICDAVDDMNYELIEKLLDKIIYCRPQITYSWCDYQLEKIFCYLEESNDYYNINWGLQQAEAFSKEFAKDYVVIDTTNMSFTEIKLLVSIACFYENKRQEKEICDKGGKQHAIL